LINFKCTKCGELLEAPESMAGQAVQCPKCKLHEKVPNYRLITPPSGPPGDYSPKIKFLCNKCNGPIDAPESLAGKLFPCPRCDHLNTVPLRSADPAFPYSPGNWFYMLAVIILIVGILLAMGLSDLFFFFAFSLSMILFAFGSTINRLAEIIFYLKKRDNLSKKRKQ